MTSYDAPDASADNLEWLMALAPDSTRAERVRARCRTQLARSRRSAARATHITEFAWRVVAPIVVGAVGVLYAAVLAATTLRLGSIFH